MNDFHVQYIRYLNLPLIPDSIVENIYKTINHVDPKVVLADGNYIWSDSFNSEVDTWCKKNICDTLYFGFQMMDGHIKAHKDMGSYTKLVYLLEPGGTDVITNFWDDDKVTLLKSYKIEPRRWHLLKADTFHSIENILPEQKRFSVASRVFGGTFDIDKL